MNGVVYGERGSLRMFTGIIEETGTIHPPERTSDGIRVRIEARKVLEGGAPGDSISVDGVCLTVSSVHRDYFIADLSTETLERSSFSLVKAPAACNLERALRPLDRMGGHIVQGHVDTTGKIILKKNEVSWTRMRISSPPAFNHYICEKGSIAVSGVSLTIADFGPDSFDAALIPETLKRTTLGRLSAGSVVNLEYDILAKYIERMLTKKNVVGREGILMEALQRSGYV